MLSLGLLNAEKLHSSESNHVSWRTNGPLVLVEGWGGVKIVCVCGGGGERGYWLGLIQKSEKSLEGDGHSGLLSECFCIGRATYESYNNVAPNEIYTCFMPSK